MSTANQGLAGNAAHRHEENLQDKASAAAQTVRAAADDFRRAAQQRGGEVLQSAREIGAEAKQAAQERYAQVRDTAGEIFEQGRERAMDLEHTLESQIRDKPIKSLLIAAGIGFVLGMVFIRR